MISCSCLYTKHVHNDLSIHMLNVDFFMCMQMQMITHCKCNYARASKCTITRVKSLSHEVFIDMVNPLYIQFSPLQDGPIRPSQVYGTVKHKHMHKCISVPPGMGNKPQSSPQKGWANKANKCSPTKRDGPTRPTY